MSTKYVYVLAIVERELDIYDPGSISFLHTDVWADSEAEAYTLGARALGFKNNGAQVCNDYVINLATLGAAVAP